MPSRSLLQYATILAKGLAMGAADVVPGVSGGTIAFISGIYEELIETIHKLDLGFFKLWKKTSFSVACKEYNIMFLIALFGGVFISVLSLAKVITYLLTKHPILIWSFFFGLVIASILFVGKQITTWNLKVVIATVLAVLFSYFITIAEPLGSPDSTWFLFFAGFIAIIAMILPGISGSFILLLLGAYSGVLGILTSLSKGITTLNWDIFSDAFIKLIIFGTGAVLGLKVFSRALNWLFKHHKNLILAILTGFMIGALNKIWPWKEVLSTRLNSHGEEVTFLDKSILPTSFDGDPQIILAIAMAVVGFLVIFLMERFANSKKNRIEKA
ncbi:predicted membrane protein [unidentified eubacterium SCB49]|nr:predicted membrane protein [unidentified eubacterium SCB49]